MLFRSIEERGVYRIHQFEKQMDENVRHARKEMIDVSLDKAVEIMEERMTA